MRASARDPFGRQLAPVAKDGQRYSTRGTPAQRDGNERFIPRGSFRYTVLQLDTSFLSFVVGKSGDCSPKIVILFRSDRYDLHRKPVDLPAPMWLGRNVDVRMFTICVGYYPRPSPCIPTLLVSLLQVSCALTCVGGQGFNSPGLHREISTPGLGCCRVHDGSRSSSSPMIFLCSFSSLLPSRLESTEVPAKSTIPPWQKVLE